MLSRSVPGRVSFQHPALNFMWHATFGHVEPCIGVISAEHQVFDDLSNELPHDKVDALVRTIVNHGY